MQTSQSSFTFLSNMVGASLLSCGFIVHKLGWVLGAIAFGFATAYSYFVFHYFVECAHYAQVRSLRELTEKIISKKLSIVLDIGTMVSYFGFMTAYMIISSTSVISFVKNVFNYELNSYAVKAVIAVVIVFPLCLLRSLKQLSKIASISGLFILVTGFTIIVYFFMYVRKGELCETDEGHQIKFSLNTWPDATPIMSLLYFLMYIPSLCGNFSAHSVIPTMVVELQGVPVLRKRIVHISLNISLGIAAAMYLLVGYFGASMFGSDVTDNILLSFTPCHWVWPSIVSLMYAFVVVIVYPLIIYTIKLSILGLCHTTPETKKGYKIMVIISAIFVVLTTAVAMAIESLVAIFGFFASLTGILLYFAVPILFFEKYPKVKKQYAYMDKPENGNTVVDPVIVGVLSMMHPEVNKDNINRIRTMSNKIFGKQNAQDAGEPTKRRRTMSFFKQNEYRIEQDNARGKTKIKVCRTYDAATELCATESVEPILPLENAPSTRMKELAMEAASESSTTHNETKDLLVERSVLQPKLQPAREDVVTEEQTVEELTHPEEGDGEISKSRKVCARTAIGIFSVICMVGVVMNAIDVVNTFK